MRIIEDKYGNRFLEVENKEDFRKFKEICAGIEDLIRKAIKKIGDGTTTYFLIARD